MILQVKGNAEGPVVEVHAAFGEHAGILRVVLAENGEVPHAYQAHEIVREPIQCQALRPFSRLFAIDAVTVEGITDEVEIGLGTTADAETVEHELRQHRNGEGEDGNPAAGILDRLARDREG